MVSHLPTQERHVCRVHSVQEARTTESEKQNDEKQKAKLESEVQDSHHISNLPPVTEEGSDLSTESEKQNDEIKDIGEPK